MKTTVFVAGLVLGSVTSVQAQCGSCQIQVQSQCGTCQSTCQTQCGTSQQQCPTYRFTPGKGPIDVYFDGCHYRVTGTGQIVPPSMTIRRTDLAPSPATSGRAASPINGPIQIASRDGVYRNNRRIASGFEPNFEFKTGDVFVQAGESTIANVIGTSTTFTNQNNDLTVAAK